MSDMKKLLESIDKLSFANPKQKPGDQVRGTDKAVSRGNKHPFQDRLVGEGFEDEGNEGPMFGPILRRIMSQHLDVLGKYGPQRVMDAARDVAEFHGDVDEIGSSDVSAAVKQVIDQLDSHGQFEDEIRGEYENFIKEEPPTAATPAATTTANTSATSATVSPQQAQQAVKDAEELKQNLNRMKSVNPTLDVNKTISALSKDPAQLGAVDQQALGQLGSTVASTFKDTGATQTMKNLIQKLQVR